MGESETKPGIKCPNCGCQDFRDEQGRPWDIVRTIKLLGHIRRYRICRYCGKKIRTKETIDKK